jgi:OOP family OmpA-OmpF porin
MERKLKVWGAVLTGIVSCIVTAPLQAVEVITQEDITSGIITEEHLVKVADNAVFLLDTSSSMNDDFADTDTPMIDVVKNELINRNSYFPSLGHNFTIVKYTGWEVLYPTAVYDREKVAAALDAIPDKGRGPTPLKRGLERLEGILEAQTGKTAVFLFSDGEYTGGSPREVAVHLANTYDICAYVISTAKPEREAALKEDVASLNNCSRMIPFADFIAHPEYTSGALFDVKVTEGIVTVTDRKIVGLKVDNIHFEFDESVLSDTDKAELDELAEFMKGYPDASAVIAGYTDNAGTADYNVGLSRKRTEMVATYLKDNHGWTDSQMVLLWYGAENPIVPNDTPENMATNRRVEVTVSGL